MSVPWDCLSAGVGEGFAMAARPRTAAGRIELHDSSATAAPEPPSVSAKRARCFVDVNRLTIDRQPFSIPGDARDAGEFAVERPEPGAFLRLCEKSCAPKRANVDFAC